MKKIHFKELNIMDASVKMAEWKKSSVTVYLEENLPEEYLNLRKELVAGYNEINTNSKYVYDLEFGLKIYAILKEYGFTTRAAANDNVWRYLSLYVVPDLVERRWGKGTDKRYYKESNRIWLKTIWWYIFLSWQGDLAETKKILGNNSTDEIMHLVDRAGKKGYFVDTYRKIMYYYWKIRESEPSVNAKDFKKIMVLHTAACTSIEPFAYENGIDGYVKMVFEKYGLKVEA